MVPVDECDKPIPDALEDPDLARANRDCLRGLYSVVKDSDAHIRFSLIAGVSKFSKASLFSGLNNLRDITLDPPPLQHLRLHGVGPGRGVRAGAAGPRPRAHPRVAQRLRLAGRGEGVQPVRHPAAVRQPPVRGALVRDRHARLPAADAAEAAGGAGGAGAHGGDRRAGVALRRGRHRHRGAAVPDRIPHRRRRARAARPHRLRPRLSEPARRARG